MIYDAYRLLWIAEIEIRNDKNLRIAGITMDNRDIKTKLNISFVMLALAIIALGTATFAWFSLSLSTKVNTMELEVTAGTHLKIDVQRNSTLDAYESELDQTDIEGQIGHKFDAYKLAPLTSANGKDLYDKNKLKPSDNSLKFMEFTLYFMASAPMDVYLTEDNSDGKSDGTKVESHSSNSTTQRKIQECVRISFESGGDTVIYEPNKNGNTTLSVLGQGTQKTFTDAKTGNNDSRLFTLSGSDLREEVIVRIWIEGDDSDCNDDVISAKFKTQLRFEGVESN